ncbi:MAG: hypothetical protein GY710_10260 [Desulfobacteraceae bacterium]|nr:hypothetical protein [Desulfobacteraceae bacterium]
MKPPISKKEFQSLLWAEPRIKSLVRPRRLLVCRFDIDIFEKKLNPINIKEKREFKTLKIMVETFG